MTYSTTFAQVSLSNSSPAWRQILVVSDKNSISFPNPSIIKKTDMIDDINYTTIYYTTGFIFRQIKKDGVYYYWFILNKIENEENVSKEIFEQQIKINDILTGGSVDDPKES